MGGSSSLFFFLFLLMWCCVHPHSACNGSVGECGDGGVSAEFLMDSETNSKMLLLEQRKYISPGALKKDQPVCDDGASGDAYGKTGGCIPPPSNPYTRGCSKYYRCRSDS